MFIAAMTWMWFISIQIPVEIWPPVWELRQEDKDSQAIQGCIDPSGKEEKFSHQCCRWEN